MKVGIWLDHRSAIVVHVTEQDSKVHTIHSHIYVHKALSEQSAAAAGREHMHNQLQKYYQHIVKMLNQPEALYLIGPGDAKLELAHRIKSDSTLGSLNIDIETAYRLTIPQIVSRVRKHFGLPPKKHWFPPHFQRYAS